MLEGGGQPEPLDEEDAQAKTGTAVDATLISAPSSTKNASGEREPEMKQSKKGKQWYFGMKAHIGVDAESGLGHWVRGTAGPFIPATRHRPTCCAELP